MSIPFTRPFVRDEELRYVSDAIRRRSIASDGVYTQACMRLLEQRFGITRALFTPSCTAALEMAAILCDIKPGDEVILPSYTFVSTANAFVLRGAKPVFVDIRDDTLCIDERAVEAAITARTRVIVPVHYAGVSCDMDAIMAIAQQHNLIVVEDAAQGVHAYHRGRALGSIGHLAAYSFHDTKNYACGEGGALCINDERFVARAEMIRDKGTNRQQFYRGVVDKYTWVDVGSSFLGNELAAAFLLAQLESLDEIRTARQVAWQYYLRRLSPLIERGLLAGPRQADTGEHNYHMFYVVATRESQRDALMAHLRNSGIQAVFHYLPLHLSPMGRELVGETVHLPVTEAISGRLLRLPLYCDMTREDQDCVIAAIHRYFATSM